MTSDTKSMWSSVTPFIVGFVSGIGAGILMAPQSGARTRRQLNNLAHDLEKQTDHFVSDARASLGKVIERGKRLVV
jgi:gas vesicle protein